MLEGDFQDASISELEHLLISHMKARTNLDAINHMITESEWCGKIVNWPESTSTSPSGFHLSHSKAIARPVKCDTRALRIY